jgi:endonuclease YncB( thermonuclease family)
VIYRSDRLSCPSTASCARGAIIMFRLLAMLALVLVTAQDAAASFISPQQIRVIEGDMIVADGRTVRLSGFVTPDPQGSRCVGERELGVKATRRVRELIEAGDLDYSPVACSCPTTFLGRLMCRATRSCGVLKSHGRDIGEILIAEGLAAPFVCEGEQCPKAPRPWCESSTGSGSTRTSEQIAPGCF